MNATDALGVHVNAVCKQPDANTTRSPLKINGNSTIQAFLLHRTDKGGVQGALWATLIRSQVRLKAIKSQARLLAKNNFQSLLHS